MRYGFEHVAGLAHRLDERRPGGVELAAQVADVRLDHVRVAAEVVSPDVLQDLPLREHAPGVEQEEAQQRELGRRELELRLAAEDLVARLVEVEVLVAEHVAGKVAGCPPQDRLHARDDLGEAERLRHVVVASGPERLDLVLDRVLRGEEQDRVSLPALAQPAADLDPLDVREHPVEDDEIRVETRDRGERLTAGPRLLDLEPLVAQGGRDRVDDRPLVVYDEDPRAVAVGRSRGFRPRLNACHVETCEPPENRRSPSLRVA